MDCEIFDLVRHMMRGIEVDEERLALEVIDAVGPGGNFLAQKHTRRHMRERWNPRFMDRRPYDVWEAEGGDAVQWATEEAQRILDTHEVASLAPALVKELARMVEAVAGNRPDRFLKPARS
jgi:trimethylamine--corrinoid protein Co-methyltransferase